MNRQIAKHDGNSRTKIKLMYTRRMLIVAAFTCTVLSLFLCTPVASASTKVRFKQIIAPLNCIFDEVNDGSGVVVYLTPETCGTVIQPQQYRGRAASNPLPAAQSQWVPEAYYSGSLYLDSMGGGTNAQNGYMLIVHAGLVYSYRLSADSPVGALRTIEITSIRNGIVTITFGPGDMQAKLREGQYIKANVAYDANVDLEVTVVRINDDGSAIIRVAFPVQSEPAPTTEQTDNTAVAIGLLWMLAGLALYVHAHSRYRGRHARYYDRNWRIEQTIK